MYNILFAMERFNNDKNHIIIKIYYYIKYTNTTYNSLSHSILCEFSLDKYYINTKQLYCI